MTFRKVKQYSDRGKIKDLASKHESEAEFLPSELRLRRLYEYAKQHNDQGILNTLGFITTEYVEDKNALPLIAYRIKQVIADISSKSGDKIQKLKNEFEDCFSPPLSAEASDYISRNQMIKSASLKKPPVFRRVK
jgi:hypothetical protein